MSAVHIITTRQRHVDSGTVLIVCSCGHRYEASSERDADTRYTTHILNEIRADRAEGKRGAA